jgi:hypothetical protein
MPPPSFFHCSFRTGAALAAPISFLFVLNGGSTRRPRFFPFLFERGQHSLPPCLFFLFRMGTAHAVPNSFRSEQGQHLLPPFLFRFERGQCVSHMPPPVSFGFDRGGSPPPFCVLYPPIMGGILFFYFN